MKWCFLWTWCIRFSRMTVDLNDHICSNSDKFIFYVVFIFLMMMYPTQLLFFKFAKKVTPVKKNETVSELSSKFGRASPTKKASVTSSPTPSNSVKAEPASPAPTSSQGSHGYFHALLPQSVLLNVFDTCNCKQPTGDNCWSRKMRVKCLFILLILVCVREICNGLLEMTGCFVCRSGSPKKTPGPPETLLWVDKYKPQSMKQIIGQQGDKSNARKLLNWLKNWHKNRTLGKKPACEYNTYWVI